MDQAGYIGVHHKVPIGKIGLLCGGGAQCQSRVIDQHIDVAPGGGEGLRQGIDGCEIGDIQLHGQEVVPQFGVQFRQTFGPPPDADHTMAIGDKAAGDGAAKPGGDACDKQGE